MTEKFGRNYRVTIDPKDGKPPIVVTMPFTLRFSVQRSTLSDLNSCIVEIFNLSAANRSRIFQDYYDLTQNRTIILEAGYDTLYQVFVGRIFQAGSSREGTNIVTKIEARDGSYDISSSQVFTTLYNPGQTVSDVLKYLIGQFPTLKTGAVGDFSTPLQRGCVLNGNTWDLLKSYSANSAFIDNGKVFCLKDAEVLNNSIHVINDATGILDTPRRDQGSLWVDTLMETGVDLAQQLQIQSTVQPIYNGTYKIIAIQHSGTISEAVCGEARSSFQLLYANRFGTFQPVQSQ